MFCRHEIVNINLKNKPDWLLNVNPLGKVPTLKEPDGNVIYESLIVAEYLDDKYSSGIKQLPADPYERARQKILIEEITTKFIGKYMSVFFKGDEDATKGIILGLEQVDALLTYKSFAGQNIGYVDLMVWPWLFRLNNLKVTRGIEIPEEKYPKILSWIDRMKEFQFIKNTLYPTELLAKFANGYIAGESNYNEGL